MSETAFKTLSITDATTQCTLEVLKNNWGFLTMAMTDHETRSVHLIDLSKKEALLLSNFINQLAKDL